jgi:hypothetical protein
MRLRAHRKSPHSRPQPLTLEQLEDRTLLSGNLLITAEVPGTYHYNLMQYTPQGALVSSLPILQAPGAMENEDARGLSVDPSGNVNVFDGTLTPSLATLNTASQTWSFQTASGWGTSGNITYGNVVAYKGFIFASNMQQFNGQSYGVVRFNSSGDPPVLFAPGASFIQIALGQDGLLYGLEGTGSGPAISQTVQVFNPDSLALVRTVTLHSAQPIDIRSIAVDASGNILAASWGGIVAEYDPHGNATGESILLKAPYGYAENLISIALDTDGQVAVGGRGGEIYLTDESLTNVQMIQTGQWNVFVTFDHYIGTAPQIVTPSFSNLAGPTITYGQSSVTLGGTISAGTTYPPGSVNITLAGVTESASINPNDGTFSAVFNTSTLGVSGSPYTITYSYPGQDNYAAIMDSSKSLTVNQAVTTLSNLSSPTIVVGTPKVALSGTVGSNSPALPTGQSITVTLFGANGPLASSSGIIDSNGNFSVTLSTDALPVGSYTIQYSYAGDANFKGSSSTGTLQVTYAVNTLFDTSKPVHEGATLPIRFQVANAAGNNLSSADLTVTAIAIVGPNGQTYTPQAKGNANPDNVFRNVGLGYLYNLDTSGLAPGTYTLMVKIDDDPVLHAISFVVD